MLPLEFVVFGTPIASQGSSDAKRFWKQRVSEAARATIPGGSPQPSFDSVVVRVAYFYVNAPAADLDNIVKPIQDALKGIGYFDDDQVIDLVASMRSKNGNDRISMSAVLAGGFRGNSDFVYVKVERSSTIEVFR